MAETEKRFVVSTIKKKTKLEKSGHFEQHPFEDLFKHCELWMTWRM